MITSDPPYFAVKAAISAAGVTLKLEPIASIKSAFSPLWNPYSYISSFKFSPKFIMLSSKGPLHFASSHFLPVL